eukprot:gnl/TRDRNA2_/TRDRNA2_59241_c0_seq1.p1 gnl/TRDRNA2_/TRDRNA2_59241_c0~~gnl/TRDRNA2_/TRDRNA2_59241_c0_seq1.p1  ORF type:complete len:357 (+),score=61.81 gnl/TRDRNA2_/TRDRNA2_59241_c0_seq1:162-1232(+)
MWHGVNVRFHHGTQAYVVGLKKHTFNGQSCEVQNFDLSAKKWSVLLTDPLFHGKEILVDEKNLSLAYCLMPHHAVLHALPDSPFFERSGPCGKELIARVKFAKGQVVFAEHPFLVSTAATASSYTGIPVNGSGWPARERWTSYLEMQSMAGQDEGMRQALCCFQGLMHSERQDDQLRALQKETHEILSMMESSSDNMPNKTVWLKTITEVLLTWWTNQFEFSNGSGLGASCIHRFASLMNHSCSPNVYIKREFSEPARPGTFAPDDGQVVVTAICDIAAGETLVHNYAAREFLTWPLARRRAHLLREHGFVCQCERCSSEELQETAAAAVARSTKSSATEAKSSAGSPSCFLLSMD